MPTLCSKHAIAIMSRHAKHQSKPRLARAKCQTGRAHDDHRHMIMCVWGLTDVPHDGLVMKASGAHAVQNDGRKAGWLQRCVFGSVPAAYCT